MTTSRVKVVTETGSVYMIDPVAMTWERVTETNESGPLRTQGGVYENMLALEVGKGMTLLGEGLEFGTRVIHTSNVVSWWAYFYDGSVPLQNYLEHA